MILNTGSRTDIPAYYSEWFYNRIKAGEVYARNPYFPKNVTRYILNPSVVDIITFCTKNPAPMLARLSELNAYRQFWFVSINPYEKEIEPRVPSVEFVIESFKKLSTVIGSDKVEWRYDPIFISSKYTVEFHLKAFNYIAQNLSGYTHKCTISFIDLYEKTKRNFPGVVEVSEEEKIALITGFVSIAKKYKIEIKTCAEGQDYVKLGVDSSGCMSKTVLQSAIGMNLNVTNVKSPRSSCDCLLGNDIGVYDSCGHGCVYCYANSNQKNVIKNMKNHNPKSPLLIGELESDDIVKDAFQKSFIDRKIALF